MLLLERASLTRMVRTGKPAEPTEAETWRAAIEVAARWMRLADTAAELKKARNVRNRADNAAMDACFVNVRAMINFAFGNVNGVWGPNDIRPSDFVGHVWWPEDETGTFDREIRGRLPVINGMVLHLTWDLVTNTETLAMSLLRTTALVNYAMGLFVTKLGLVESRYHEVFLQAYSDHVREVMPELDPHLGETAFDLAPPRRFDRDDGRAIATALIAFASQQRP